MTNAKKKTPGATKKKRVAPPKPVKARTPRKSEETRRIVLDTALALFRKRGFDETKMRDIAEGAGLALGAAYYYFPSKEAIVAAYYQRAQDEHNQRALAAYEGTTDLRARLRAAFHTKLEVVAHDRRILGAVLRGVGSPDDPLSIFGAATRAIREQSIATFDAALDGQALPADLRPLVARALWTLHLGVLLYFLHDRSPRQERTRKLADGALDLLLDLLSFASLPGMGPLRARLLKVLAEAGLAVV